MTCFFFPNTLYFVSSENCPLSSLQHSLDPVGRTVSSGSLAPSLSTRSNPDHLKRISISEMALNKAPSGPSLLLQDDFHFPGYNPAAAAAGSAVLSNPRLMSRSHHNLGQMPESPEHRAAEPYGGPGQAPPGQAASLLQQHQRASSDTDSLSQQPDK